MEKHCGVDHGDSSLNSWEWLVFLTFQKHELNYRWWDFLVVLFILEQVQWELPCLYSGICFFNPVEVWNYLNYWKLPQKIIASTMVIRCWFWGALQVQCRNSQITVRWHSPRAPRVLCQQYSKCLWHPGSPLCLPGKGDKTKWGHWERKQIADNSLCWLTNGMSWFHLGVFCGDRCCEWESRAFYEWDSSDCSLLSWESRKRLICPDKGLCSGLKYPLLSWK